MNQARLPIAVLVSGTGTNLQALIDQVHGREATIVAVASNVPDAPALKRAEKHGIPWAVFARKQYIDRQERDEAMAEWLGEHRAGLIVLAGFMELLSEQFLKRFPNSVVNVHPSLLPAYPGPHPIDDALADGAEEFGVTVHYVDAGIDTGPIIRQESVRLSGAKDPDQVLRRLRPIEHMLLPLVVKEIAEGRQSVAA
ncbi:MAG TPA: phosphoribosylglycinamide formyltransferase [Solirubrobacteraceae bacterium]|nr:phosphoribosylglycinamide formyltransferase [Solirubrobacteraceae bacterium]